MTRKISCGVLFLVGLLVAFTFASCSDEDPAEVLNPFNIRFKTDLKIESDNSYLIPAAGGTYTFDIYNGEPWLYSISEKFDGKSVVYKAETRECPKIEALWATADVEKSGPNNMRLTVKISPSDKIKYRYVYVVVANSMKSKVLVFKQFGIYTDKE